MYGARGPNGELVFDPEKGVVAENLPKVGESRLLNGEVSKVYRQLRAIVHCWLRYLVCNGGMLTMI